MHTPSWSAPVSPDAAYRRASGRRRTDRFFRRVEVLDRLRDEGLHYGALAAAERHTVGRLLNVMPSETCSPTHRLLIIFMRTDHMPVWPVNYREQLSGVGCPICIEGRPEEIDGRIRFFSSQWSDGYLHLRGVQRGYAAVIWRGRHVAEPTELSDVEASAFWFDVLQVGRAMQVVYRPLKMNYQLLGNRIPHLHCLVAPRFLEDVAPGDPLPGSGYHDFPEGAVRREVAMLRELLAQP